MFYIFSNKIEKFLSPKSTDNEICFERCNGFIRKLIFQVRKNLNILQKLSYNLD